MRHIIPMSGRELMIRASKSRQRTCSLMHGGYGDFTTQPQFIAQGGFNLSAGCVCL
ncbi:hypothetical protein [Yersinia kristensenii]|uniref:hypothetical protein n=2 Tax=Yersinia kristensenii TaxID=28152 RepID=UPI00163F359B|nr:hypothetical protein [Yersinia kristensenii]